MGNTKSTIGIIVRDPAAEPLRMAAGLTVILDNISIFIVDHIPVPDEATDEHIEVLKVMGATVMSNMQDSPFEYICDAEMARALLACELVINY